MKVDVTNWENSAVKIQTNCFIRLLVECQHSFERTFQTFHPHNSPPLTWRFLLSSLLGTSYTNSLSSSLLLLLTSADDFRRKRGEGEMQDVFRGFGTGLGLGSTFAGAAHT